jgi:LysR family transcriptional regulator, transcriptional activator of nhaA
MAWLNYHHLLYFWTVAEEGSIARASVKLGLTQPTISGQLRSLEKSLGRKLFERSGRNLVLSESGQVVYAYARQIFTLGRELTETLEGRIPGSPLKLLVGVADTMPELIVYRLLGPALNLPEPVQIICESGKPAELLGQLALHQLDVVLVDSPVTPFVKVRAYNHLLGECGVSFVATAKLAAAHRSNFPHSLDGAPFLLPPQNAVLRRSLDQWFATEGIRPEVRGEFTDPALLKVFGEKGVGIFAVRTAVERETLRQYNVKLLGRIETLRERFYAISLERQLKHPAVVAITEAARGKLFASS